MGKMIHGIIRSAKGFYVGDLCYALNKRTYHDVWGGAGYEDGTYNTSNGLCFAVAGTAYGDGTYRDQSGREYDVDAGNISLVPAELAEDTEGGHYFPGAGIALFEASRGHFRITLPLGEEVEIDTVWDPADDEEDDDYYDDDWDDEE